MDRVWLSLRTLLYPLVVSPYFVPLDSGAAEELIDKIFEAGDIPHAVQSRIEEATVGNPFYIEQVVRSLIDEGAVDRLHSFDAAQLRTSGRLKPVILDRVNPDHAIASAEQRAGLTAGSATVMMLSRRPTLLGSLMSARSGPASRRDLLDAERLRSFVNELASVRLMYLMQAR